MGGFLFFKQKTAYEMRISDWSSDVCSSDLWIGAGAGKSAMVPLALSPREEADAGEPEKEWEDGCRLRNGDGRRGAADDAKSEVVAVPQGVAVGMLQECQESGAVASAPGSRAWTPLPAGHRC